MSITDTANAIRLAINPEVLAELVRLEVGGNPRPGQTRAKTEPHDTSRAVDFDRIRFALENPGLPFPETVQSAPVEAVESQPDPSPAEDGLWRPEVGKFGRTRNGEKTGEIADREARSPISWQFEAFVGSEGVYLMFSDSGEAYRGRDFDLIAEWKDEPALEMREGAWYERRDGEVRGPARTYRASSTYPWHVGDEIYTNDGSWCDGYRDSSCDLIREVPAPALDAQAIYDNNPADLVGSVWRRKDGHLGTVTILGPDDCEILWASRGKLSTMPWGRMFSELTLLRLASQEAAE